MLVLRKREVEQQQQQPQSPVRIITACKLLCLVRTDHRVWSEDQARPRQ